MGEKKEGGPSWGESDLKKKKKKKKASPPLFRRGEKVKKEPFLYEQIKEKGLRRKFREEETQKICRDNGSKGTKLLPALFTEIRVTRLLQASRGENSQSPFPRRTNQRRKKDDHKCVIWNDARE